MSTSFMRMSYPVLLLIVLIVMSSTSISKAEDLEAKTQSVINFEQAEMILADAISTFGQKLYKIIGGDARYNVIFSPLSIHSTISMVSLGVESGSGIERQLVDLLGYKNVTSAKEAAPHDAYADIMKQFKLVTDSSEQVLKDHEDSRSLMARPPVLGFWSMAVIDKTELRAPFKQSLENKYNTSIKQVGNNDEASQVATSVNDWGKQAGFSGDLVKSSDLIVEPESLILLSAVRIQGWWMKPMREQQVDKLFYNLADPNQLVSGICLTQSEVDGKFAIFSKDAELEKFMKGEQSNDELDKLEFRMAEMALIGDMTFTIIEPLKNGSINELNQLEAALMNVGPTSERNLLEKALDKLAGRRVVLERIQFPKFNFENDIDLKQILTSFGLHKLFTKQSSLNDITDIPMLISRMQHQAHIEVDKNGLKGGALSRVIATKLSLMIHRNPIRMIVQNPFLFIIRYKSVTLFMGHVVRIQ